MGRIPKRILDVLKVPDEERPTFIPWNEEDWHKERGDKKKFRWNKSRKWVSGPNQFRELVLVTKRPHYEPRISVTIPNYYYENWWLECGHTIMPIKKYPYGAPPELKLTHKEANEKLDPFEITEKQFCTKCTYDAGHWEETKTKEWYWEQKHDGDHWKCSDCGWCIICKGHQPKCIGPTRDYAFECIWENMNLKFVEPEDRDEIHDAMRSLINLLDKEQIKEVCRWYTD